MTPLAAFALGLVAATLLLSVISHWTTLLVTVVGKHGGDFLGPPKRRLLWAAPLAIVHPAPILIVAALAGGAMAGLILLGRYWEWFFAGFYSFVAYAGLLMLMAWRRSKARKVGPEPPS